MNRDFTRSGGKQNASYMVNRQCVIYLSGDIDSSCGSLSREDLMLFGIPRLVVPLLISCDSSVRDVQMTVFFLKREREGEESLFLNQEDRKQTSTIVDSTTLKDPSILLF